MNWRLWARAHLSGAALVFATAGIGGVIAGNALYYTTPRFYAGMGFQPRVINYSGAQVSGYFLVRDAFQIGGGPIRLSQDPVLKVRADRPALWRGRVYDHYDGQGWSRSLAQSRRAKRAPDGTHLVRELQPAPDAPSFTLPPGTIFRPGPPGRPPS